MASRYLDILKDWNFWDKIGDTGIARPGYLARLHKLMDLGQVVAISGVRRCGKSTILRQYINELHTKHNVPFQNTLHINFEDPRLGQNLDAVNLFEMYREYKDHLHPKGNIYVFLDEVQQVGRWEQFVRTLYDLKEKTTFVVTGSNSTVFSSALFTVLTGRVVEMSVSPLSFGEFLIFKHINDASHESIDEYLQFGGFPLVVLEKDENKKREILISYYKTIIENDVIIRHGVKNKDKVKDLALYLLSNSGNLVSSYTLEKILGISDGEVTRYMQYLEEAYLIIRVSLFSYSVKKRIYNPDKIYCIDTGLVNTAGFTFSQNKGRLLEHVVLHALLGNRKQTYYWKNGSEIDFVLFGGQTVDELVNVTQTVDDEEVLQREFKSLDLGKKEFPQATIRLLTLYNESKQKDRRIYPILKFLLNQKIERKATS